MRYVYCLAIFFGFFCSVVQADPRSAALPYGLQGRGPKGEWDEQSYRKQLELERYETALARERREQAYLNHQAQIYEYQRAQHDIHLNRTEHARRHEERSDGVTNVNQVANTVASVVRQIQVLSSGRGGV